jgi:hypothetical protein
LALFSCLCFFVKQNSDNGVIWFLAKNIPKRILFH